MGEENKTSSVSRISGVNGRMVVPLAGLQRAADAQVYATR